MPLVRLCAWLLMQLISSVVLSTPAMATSAAQTSAICDQALQIASRRTGVPAAVLKAITLTETGRKLEGAFRPWPWTVNMEGVGKWFATRQEALDYVKQNYDRGARSFDVGCFQLNYRWHGQNFASIEAMFDPVENAAYAGRFLTDLYAESGSWSVSAGAYHSRTRQYALRYRGIFDRHLARLTGTEVPPDPRHEEVPLTIAEAQGHTPEEIAELQQAPEIPWIPPPPSEFGSLAAVDYQRRQGLPLTNNAQPLLRDAQPLLTPARGGLF